MPTTQQTLDLYRPERLEWLVEAQALAKRLAFKNGEVCADDIHELLPIPGNINRRVMGGVFNGLRFRRFKKSRRKINHNRHIGVFTL